VASVRRGFSKEDLASIKVPVLLIVGDHDFVSVEHVAKTLKLIPGGELAVIPSASHFVVYSERGKIIPIIKHFLEKPEKAIPLASAEVGYHPGKTR
jgi:pimeloyl-ACP methyl ester carboxylesterase